MTFPELTAEIQKVTCKEIRARQANYLEVVVAKTYWPALTGVLQSYFGLPLKPEGQEPSAEVKHLADPHGGVYENQTLYCRKNETSCDLALLWPWGNGATLTAKIIQL